MVLPFNLGGGSRCRSDSEAGSTPGNQRSRDWQKSMFRPRGYVWHTADSVRNWRCGIDAATNRSPRAVVNARAQKNSPPTHSSTPWATLAGLIDPSRADKTIRTSEIVPKSGSICQPSISIHTDRDRPERATVPGLHRLTRTDPARGLRLTGVRNSTRDGGRARRPVGIDSGLQTPGPSRDLLPINTAEESETRLIRLLAFSRPYRMDDPPGVR